MKRRLLSLLAGPDAAAGASGERTADPGAVAAGDADRRRRRLDDVAAFVWPMIFLWRYLGSGAPAFLTIRNDFAVVFYNYKAYLLDLLAHGRFPLWSPAEACGHPLYSSPFAQAFYPLNIPLAAFCRAAGGYSHVDHQRFTVLGLSIFSLGMLRWLRSLGLPSRHALAAAMIVSVSFKMTEIVRFPNAVHAAAWMPWVLYGLTVIFRSERIRLGAFTAGAAFLMMLTAGFPYYLVYAAFLFGPYVFFMAVPRLRDAFLAAPAPAPGRLPVRLGVAALAFALPAGLCLPYFLKTVGLLAQTTTRSVPDFRFATAHAFTPLDTVASLFFPPSSQFEGWFYFGAAGFLIVCLFLCGATGDSAPPSCRLLFRLSIAFWILLVVLVTWGRHSALFRFLWGHVPLFAQMRVWGRMNVVLVPLIGLLLARSLRAFETSVAGSDEPAAPRRAGIRAALVLAGVAAGTVAVQCLLLRTDAYDPYWTVHGTAFHGMEPWFPAMTVLAALILGYLLLGRLSCKPAFIAVALVTLAAIDLYPVSSRQWAGPFVEGTDARRADFVGSWLATGIASPRVMGYYGLELAAIPRHSAGRLENWYFHRYSAFVSQWWDVWGRPRADVPEAELRAASRLLGLAGGRRIFLSRRIDHSSPGNFLADDEESKGAISARPRISRYDGDTLEVAVGVREPLWLSFIDNWDPDWIATVNGNPAHLEKLFGTFKSVRVPPGENRVTFRYSPGRRLFQADARLSSDQAARQR